MSQFVAAQIVRQFNAQQCWSAQFHVVLPPDQVDRAREFVERHAARTPTPKSAYPLIEPDPYEMWRR